MTIKARKDIAKILLGDSFQILPMLKEKSVDMIFADPPYFLSNDGISCRGGHQMENLVESYISRAGFVKDSTYFKEMYLHEVEAKWGYNLSEISADGIARKRFDFVVKPENSQEVYICECNFYTSSGSKLNETARSFKAIAMEAANIPHVNFVWFTDGAGWQKTKGNLKETFMVLDDVYNIADLKSGIIKERFT